MKIKHLFIFILIPLMLTTCVKPYNPIINKYEHIIVIDGLLTDSGNPPIVTITYSSKVDGSKTEKVVGAVVYILSSDGQKYNLTEKSQGSYTYTQSMFPVSIGTSYQLIVEHEGHVFKSTMEKMLPSSPITDISYKVKSDSKGVDLLISTQDVDTASKYYVWKLTETWKIHTSIYSHTRSVNKEICYSSTKDELQLGTTDLFSKNCFNQYPLLSIPFSSAKLFYRYSILVEQLSISRSSYVYLNYIKKTNESGGSLFDPVPANMNGNITSESEPVIGNFQVSSLSMKRIYIDRSDLPNELMISSGMEKCELEVAGTGADQKNVRDSLRKIMITMDTIKEITGTFVRYTTEERCFDCTATGSPNTPPTWWVEKK